jgi:hypothetical protein
MRPGRLWALALLVLVALPCVAAAAAPAPWPSAHDLRAGEPGLRAADAACVARFYHGRLTRPAWFAPYYTLTTAQKLVRDAGPIHCMTRTERTATLERDFASDFGNHPELKCVAGAWEARSLAARVSLTTRRQLFREYDRIFRRCGFLGALYSDFARAGQLVLTRAEQACSNRIGSSYPARSLPQGQHTSKSDLKTVGIVLDRCVGQKSEEAMWRRLLHSFRPAAAIPCVARRMSASATFVTFFTDKAALTRLAQRAAGDCLLTATN